MNEPRQSNDGMVSGPKLAMVLNAFPGAVLVPVDEADQATKPPKPRGQSVPPSLPPMRRPTMTTTDPTRDPADAPETGTGAASRPPGDATQTKEELVAGLYSHLDAVVALVEASQAMVDYFGRTEPDRLVRPGFVRLIAAIEGCEHARYVERPHLSDPAAEKVAMPARPTDTQEEAGLTALPTSGSARLAVLNVIQFEDGATDEEIAQFTTLALNTVRPRRGELVADGWVEDSGVRRETEAGNAAIVWKLTAPAREKLGGSA